jgi:uncharacterized protein DUF3383
MATVVDDIVQVTITRESSAVSRAGFGTPLFVSVHTRFAERIRFYEGGSILADMVADGFLSSDVAYLQAQAALSVAPRPSRIAIGRAVTAVAQSIDFTIVDTGAGAYVITINGEVHSYTSPGGETAGDIRDELLALLLAGGQASVITFTTQGGASIRALATVAGNQFTYVSTGPTTGAAGITDTVNAAGNGPIEDMDAIEAENAEDWYGFAFNTRAEELILDLAAWTEARVRLFSSTSDDADVPANTAGNVLLRLQALGYRNTFYTWNDPDSELYMDAAYLARGLVADLDARGGQITWANKELSGQQPDVLTGGERSAIHAANGNTYERRAGKNITREGQVVQGDYIDVTTTIHWLDSRMTEDVFACITGTSTKIPFTQAGIDLIEAVVRRRLQIAVDNGHLRSFTVTIPTLDEVLDSDLEDRTLRNVQFTAELAGAIHRVIINGRIAV